MAGVAGTDSKVQFDGQGLTQENSFRDPAWNPERFPGLPKALFFRGALGPLWESTTPREKGILVMFLGEGFYNQAS